MLIVLYLAAIVIANLAIVYFGSSVAILNAFLFIGLDLTVRDGLHEQWQGRYFWLKISGLIGSGSLLSWLLNYNAGPIAIASFAAFAGAGLADTLTYWFLGSKARLIKINGSNVISAGVDSFVFITLAFGFPVLWNIIIGQFVAKVIGGFAWSVVLRKLLNHE